MGAHQRSVDDLMLAGASSQRFAPGWDTRYGQLYFERERARAGYGMLVDSPICYPPAGAVPSIGDPTQAAQRAPEAPAFEPVWRGETSEGRMVSMVSIAAELSREQSGWLHCDPAP